MTERAKICERPPAAAPARRELAGRQAAAQGGVSAGLSPEAEGEEAAAPHFGTHEREGLNVRAVAK